MVDGEEDGVGGNGVELFASVGVSALSSGVEGNVEMRDGAALLWTFTDPLDEQLYSTKSVITPDISKK